MVWPRVLVSLLLSFVALHGEVRAQDASHIPFDVTRRVQVHPPDFDPPLIGRAGIRRLETELARLRYPFHVVLAQALPGFGDEDERAKALTDGLAAAWSSQGYDPAISTVFALTFEPRTFSLLVGSRWGAELGLRDAALDPYLDKFLARVRATPTDPVGGIIAMAQALDEHIFDQIDPARVAARKAAALEKARMQARLRLGEAINRAEALLRDEDHTPADVTPFRERIERARALMPTADEATLTHEVIALQEDLRPLAEHVSASREAARARAQLVTTVLIVVGLLLAFALVFFIVRSAQLSRRRKAFAAIADAWDERTKNAAGRYVEFYGKRDAILGLLELEGKTAALLEQVTAEVDGIYSAVAAMEAHVDACADEARRARWFRLAPIDRALAKIEAPFDFDTGVLNEADLFGPPTKQLRIDPQTLEAELESRFASSIMGWKRLETAAELRFHEAVALFPHTLLDGLLETAAAQRIPARWLVDHPLFGDEAQDKTIWEEADQWRWKDAIAFLEAIEALRERHAAVEARLARLVAVRERIAAVRLAELPEIAPAGTTTYDAADDPADTIEDAKSAEIDLDRKILAADLASLDRIEEAAAATVALYEETAAQIQRIRDALAFAEPEVQAAQRLMDNALSALDELGRQAERAAGVHLFSRASTFVEVAARRLESGRAELDQARARLAQRRHLDAHRLAERAKAAMVAVREEAERGLEHIDALDQTRLAYERRVSEMSAVREAKIAEIRRYNGTSFPDAWHAPAVSLPADFAELTRALDAVVEIWNGHVRTARIAWEEAERRRREAEEAERRRRAAAAARRASSTSWSSSSSSSSRSSFSSFRSSSSSSSSRSSSGGWSSSRSSSRSGRW